MLDSSRPPSAEPDKGDRPVRRPKVTVGVPTYEGRFLGQTVKSVLAQEFTDFELVVVDNAASATRNELFAGFQDSRVRYVPNTHNVGMLANWNRCIELANGEYLAILHDDDLWERQFLARTVAVLETNPNVGLVFTAVDVIDDKGTRRSVHVPYGKDRLLRGHDEFHALLAGNHVRCPSVIVRRGCYDEIGRFDETLGMTADWDMWLRIALKHDIGYLAAPLASYRSGHGGFTDRQGTLSGTIASLACEVAVFRKAAQGTSRTAQPRLERAARRALSLASLRLAITHAIAGNARAALRATIAGLVEQRQLMSTLEYREVAHAGRVAWRLRAREKRLGPPERERK